MFGRHEETRILTTEERITGAYLGLAIGDALGATTEFLTPNEIREKHGVHRNISGGGWLNLRAGRVTDDTEMTLALGQTIIGQRAVKAVPVAEAFSQWMKTKPVDIGNTVRRGIIHYRTSGNAAVMENEFDAGNGACMRCLPVAVFYRNAPLEILQKASREQAHTTHHNAVSDAGTETVLQMLVSTFSGSGKESLHCYTDALIKRHPAYRFDRRPVSNPSGWIVETLQSVFQAFFSNDTFEDILVDVVNRGGDADTTGAIAGMLAGGCYGRHAIPGRWLDKLDSRTREACISQAVELYQLS